MRLRIVEVQEGQPNGLESGTAGAASSLPHIANWVEVVHFIAFETEKEIVIFCTPMERRGGRKGGYAKSGGERAGEGGKVRGGGGGVSDLADDVGDGGGALFSRDGGWRR